MESRPEFAAAWLAQWTRGAAELQATRDRELRELSEADARAATEAVLSLADPATPRPGRWERSGLTAQQAIFRRALGGP